MKTTFLFFIVMTSALCASGQTASEFYATAKRQIDSLDKIKKGADYSNVFNLLHHATDLDPRLKEAWYESGRLMFRTGSNSLALEYINKALALDAKYADALAVRGSIYCQTKETKKQGCADLKKARNNGCEKAQELLDRYCK